VAFGYQLRPSEEVLVEASANLLRGPEAMGGRMRITNLRIIFEPHAINLQSQPEEIPIGEIVEVGGRRTWGLISNGLFIRTRNGLEHKFVVWGRDRLIRMIEELMASGHSPPARYAAGRQTSGDLASELERLATLHARGVLTDEEFERAKSRLLGP
jgi:Short C-terminal domain